MAQCIAIKMISVTSKRELHALSLALSDVCVYVCDIFYRSLTEQKKTVINFSVRQFHKLTKYLLILKKLVLKNHFIYKHKLIKSFSQEHSCPNLTNSNQL